MAELCDPAYIAAAFHTGAAVRLAREYAEAGARFAEPRAALAAFATFVERHALLLHAEIGRPPAHAYLGRRGVSN